MGVYITTSKSASRGDISLCHGLAGLIPNSAFERRGRKTVESVVSRARLLGKSRALVVSGSELHFLKIAAGSWEWLGPVLSVEKAEFAELPKGLPPEIQLEGKSASQWLSLLNQPEPESDDFIVMSCEANAVSFTCSGKKLGEVRFSRGSKD